MTMVDDINEMLSGGGGRTAKFPEIGTTGPAHLLDIRACESTDRYDAVSPSGSYRGAYQFGRRTWDWTAADHAGRHDLVGVDPIAATPADQDAMAVALYVADGPGHWPVCGRR